MEPAKPAKEKINKMKKAHIRKKKQLMKPCYINPWEFEDAVTPLDEDLSLTKLELGELECRSNYSIRLLLNTKENFNDLLYKIYGEEINKSPGFMRNWIRLYTMTNKKKLEQVARNFLDLTNTNLTAWIKGIRSGTKGNLLSLYLLSLVTGTHCCIHLKQNKIWSTLKEKPLTHVELMQRCNVHLAYMGHNNYIQLSLRTTTVQYKFFGIDDPVLLTESETVTEGNLSKEELLTIDMIMAIPKPPLEPVNSGAPEKQTTNIQVVTAEIHAPQDYSPQRKQTTDVSNGAPAIQTANILLVTADIHAPYDYSPPRKHLSDVHIRHSPNTNSGYTKKDDAKTKLISQRNEENEHKTSKIVLTKKLTLQTKERQKSSSMEGEHNSEDTKWEHTILDSAMCNEESMDSDSTILYDIPETKLINKGDAIETDNLPELSLLLGTANVHKSTTKSVKHPTTKISKTNKSENQQVYKPKKQKKNKNHNDYKKG